MSLNDTPLSGRTVISFFGCMNAGKSTLVNALTGQSLSVVSDVPGTTTDPVRKTMELLPLGPVVIIDTPGFDDSGSLGDLRVRKAREILDQSDVAVLVLDAAAGPKEADGELFKMIRERDLPCLLVFAKADLAGDTGEAGSAVTKAGPSGSGAPAAAPAGHEKSLRVSAVTGEGIEALKEALASLAPSADRQRFLLRDLVRPGDSVVLVCPIDESAPKGRIILPQQQAIRDLLDAGALAHVCRDTELPGALAALKDRPAMVVTDSQAFRRVAEIVPDEVPLTSFSILMARLKGFLGPAVAGARAIRSLRDGDRVLMAEGCTHHRQCGDIGTVKIPALLRNATGKELRIETCSGHDFPEDLRGISLVIHCGGCMLNGREVTARMNRALSQGVPFTNYGIAIAALTGILERSIRLFPELREAAP